MVPLRFSRALHVLKMPKDIARINIRANRRDDRDFARWKPFAAAHNNNL
jgi:hypothetical protein